MRVTFDATTGRLIQECPAHITVLLPWPAVKAYRKVRTAWVACQPSFALPPDSDTDARPEDARQAGHQAKLPDTNYQGLEEIKRYCALFPVNVRASVLMFPERHWDLLAWMARTGFVAEELLVSNPAIGFAVACGADLCVGDAAVHYLQKRFLLAYHGQKEILSRLGFPPTERVRRILRKVPARLLTVAQLLQLRAALADNTVAERLAHVPIVNAAVLRLVQDGNVARLSPAALAEVARDGNEGEAVDLARKLADVVQLWGLVRPGLEPPREFDRVGRVQATHAEVSADSIASAFDRRNPLPPPPIRGTDTIVPITSRSMLMEESRLQRNCVADYEDKVARGDIAIYRVLAPQRCTLSLKRRRGRWVISELKTRRNGAASLQTHQTVLAWFDPLTSGLKLQHRQSSP